jgi:hypothetical protein
MEGVAAVPAEDEPQILVHMDDRTKLLDCLDDGVLHFALLEHDS